MNVSLTVTPLTPNVGVEITGTVRPPARRPRRRRDAGPCWTSTASWSTGRSTSTTTTGRVQPPPRRGRRGPPVSTSTPKSRPSPWIRRRPTPARVATGRATSTGTSTAPPTRCPRRRPCSPPGRSTSGRRHRVRQHLRRLRGTARRGEGRDRRPAGRAQLRRSAAPRQPRSLGQGAGGVGSGAAREHPLVWTRRNGRKSLLLGATAGEVVGWPARTRAGAARPPPGVVDATAVRAAPPLAAR